MIAAISGHRLTSGGAERAAPGPVTVPVPRAAPGSGPEVAATGGQRGGVSRSVVISAAQEGRLAARPR